MKRLFTTFLIVLSICSIAHATLGRIKGLGVNQIFYNDDQLTDIFPHYLSQYMEQCLHRWILFQLQWIPIFGRFEFQTSWEQFWYIH